MHGFLIRVCMGKLPVHIALEEDCLLPWRNSLASGKNGDGIIQCSTFRKKSWGQPAPKFSFLVARTSILVAKNYI